MTDRFDDLPPGKVLMPEVIDEPSESILTPEEITFITYTVTFINRTVSAKALETALMIGDYILTNYFDDDIESAFSKSHNKPASFNILCEHPDLKISRQQLVNMVKVAAQERFFLASALNFTRLNYTHRLKLTPLPNDDAKVELASECDRKNLSTRQLGYRVKMIASQAETEDNDSSQTATTPITLNDLSANLRHIARRAEALNFDPFVKMLKIISPDSKMELLDEIARFMRALDQAAYDCEAFAEHIMMPGM